jgi:hypothetical protein
MPLVDLIVEQQSSGILDDLNDPNFCGYAFTLAFVGYVGNPSIISNANLSTIVIIDEALWSLLAKQINFSKPKSGNATTWAFSAINNVLITLSKVSSSRPKLEQLRCVLCYPIIVAHVGF